MRKLQNLRQLTIKKNKWQRTNVEKQKLSKNSKDIKTNKSEKDQITHFLNYLKRTACTSSPLTKDTI